MNKQTFVYKKKKNCSIKADIYLNFKNNSSIIIFIHGGALIWDSRESIIPEQIELYNEAGFSVISIDYRLAPETKLEEIIKDIYDAIKWIKQNIEPEKIAIVGSSAGGFLSLLTGSFDIKPKAIVSFYGYGDIIADWYCKPSFFYCQKPLVSKEEAYSFINKGVISEGSTERIQYYLYCRQNGIWTSEVSGYDILSYREKLKEFCPIYNINKDYPPTLLLHGDEDTDVPYKQSVVMANKLQTMGIESKLITLKGKNHAFDYDMKDKQVILAFEEVLSFLKEHIK